MLLGKQGHFFSYPNTLVVHRQYQSAWSSFLVFCFSKRLPEFMKSIFEKIALMLSLANGEVVRHCHAVLARIIVKEPGRISSLFPKGKSRYNSKRFFDVQALFSLI